MKLNLTSEQWAKIDQALRTSATPIKAIKLVLIYCGAGLAEAMEAVEERRVKLKDLSPLDLTPKHYSIADLVEQVGRLPSTPAAIEVFWDGDTQGWFLRLTAVLAQPSESHPFSDHYLSLCLAPEVESQLLEGELAEWPQAVVARKVGREIASRLDVPFYFPSPDHPEDECPRWWEREQGVSCRRCGILLLQRDPCPWRGVCYFCHLDETRAG